MGALGNHAPLGWKLLILAIYICRVLGLLNKLSTVFILGSY
jgi:hypothetical protein